MSTRDEIIRKINRLSGLETFLDTLLYLSDKNLNSYVDELGQRDMRTILNVNELTFLFGLWLKNKNKKSHSTLSAEEVGKKIHDLMDDLHWTFMPNITDDQNTTYKDKLMNAAMLQETIFYSGTGAYDYQYVKFVDAEYKYDKDWIREKRSIDISRVLDFYSFFKGVLNYRINFTSKSRHYLDIYKYNKKSFIFEKYPEFQKLMQAFSIKHDEEVNHAFHNIGDLNVFSIRPIIEYDDYYLIPIPFLLAEALNKSPYYWFRDDKNYKKKAEHNRGKVSEEIVFNILNKSYEGAVFQNVFVKPNKTKTITDLDVCLIDEETMVIFQVKSKKLTQLSKQGNLDQIRKDYQFAVTNAYEQSFLAYEPILKNQCKLVNLNNSTLIDTSKIQEIFTVCIVFDNYPPLTSHTIIFNENEAVTPVAISVFDLEVCVEYLKTKSDFVDYIRRRSLYSKYYHSESELSFLQFHLQYKLEPKETADKVMLDNNFAQQFDEKYYMQLLQKYEDRLAFFIDDIRENDFCFCGTGNQFKDCCMELLSTT